MKKSRSNAAWNALSPEQRQTLEGWLFDDGLGYEPALERARKELGYTGAASSLKRFYQYTAQERTLSNLADSAKLSSAIDRRKATTEDMQRSGMKLLAQWFLQKMAESPDDVKQWAPAARMLLAREANELKNEENEVRRGWLKFALEKLSHDRLEEGLKILPQLEELADSRKDPTERKFADNKFRNRLMKEFFGDEVQETLPENKEEEKAMRAAGKLPRGYDAYVVNTDDETENDEKCP